MLHSRIEFLANLCRGLRVLHLGCADWPYTERRIREGQLLHKIIGDVAKDLVGVDLSREGIDQLATVNPKWELHVADACTFAPDKPVDLVLASELIEHLENPGLFLTGLRKWAKPELKLILTTPNAYSAKGAVRAVFGKEFCHPDHTMIFSTKSLTQLLQRTRWATDKIDYYHCPADSLVAKVPSGAVLLLGTLMSSRIGDGLIVQAHPVT